MNITRLTPAGADWIAGLSIAGLLLPEAVAYSGIAGAPPQAGVIALFSGLLVYGLMGGSRFAIVSATSSSAAILAASLATLGGTVAERMTLAITADAPGRWAMHCHLLLHMEMGMFRVVEVSPASGQTT